MESFIQAPRSYACVTLDTRHQLFHASVETGARGEVTSAQVSWMWYRIYHSKVPYCCASGYLAVWAPAEELAFAEDLQ